jgi:hypothetical protein
VQPRNPRERRNRATMSAPTETTTPRARRLPHTFGWTLLAACTALIAIAAVHFYSVYRADRIGRETAERASVELVRQVMVADVAAAVTDLMVLARHIEQMTLAAARRRRSARS